MNLEKLFLQRKYADQLSLRLPQFTLKTHSPYQANFRCDICGDSAQNKRKKRGYLLEKNGTLMYHCHNGCGTINFEHYLKTYHTDLYNQYVFDIISSRDNYEVKETKPVEKKEIRGDFLEWLTKITDLPAQHSARTYLLQRKIPLELFKNIYFTDRFYSYVNFHIPEKFNSGSLKHDHPRIIFPMCREDGSVFGVNARALDPNNEQRYFVIKFDETPPKIFGLERWKRNLHTYAVEGPIDSLFLKNSIALTGTDGDLNSLKINKEKITIVLDNQPRNKEVISKYSKYISQGYPICIWPERIKSKDVNEMILSGMSANEVQSTIDKNTFQNINALIEFNKWKKI